MLKGSGKVEKCIKVQKNASVVCYSEDAALFGKECADHVREYHRSFPAYEQTSLSKLSHLAELFGVHSIYVKDESTRFGLNAFKGLGGSYCIGKYIGELCNIPSEQLGYDLLIQDKIKEKTKRLTFVTATDGNHGRGIAWTAHELGLKAVVYMPKGSAVERLANIQKLGAKAEITNLNYDDTVRFAAECEKTKGWILVQDTAWDGYEKIPTWIMQGYTTMALEAVEQMDNIPTHIFLQAGVGAMSGALAAFFADYYREQKPKIIIVEPDQADCIYRTAEADDGKVHVVKGDMKTIMAGLACGEPCTIGWKMLKQYADFFVSIPDEVAAKGMRVLGNSLAGDEAIVSGESGAATMGLVSELLSNEKWNKLKDFIGLDKQSRILCFSTEGDTDQENYRRIVWDGAYPNV